MYKPGDTVYVLKHLTKGIGPHEIVGVLGGIVDVRRGNGILRCKSLDDRVRDINGNIIDRDQKRLEAIQALRAARPYVGVLMKNFTITGATLFTEDAGQFLDLMADSGWEPEYVGSTKSEVGRLRLKYSRVLAKYGEAIDADLQNNPPYRF